MSDAPPPGFPPPPPSQPKKTSGCVLALVVSGVVVLLLGVGLAIAGYMFAQTDEGKAVIATLSVAAKATQGPGPDALRGAGCTEGAVMRYDEMNKAAQALLADAGPEAAHALGSGIEVICINPTKPITCEDVVLLFVRAEKPATEFVAKVQANEQDRCKVTALPDGTLKKQ